MLESSRFGVEKGDQGGWHVQDYQGGWHVQDDQGGRHEQDDKDEVSILSSFLKCISHQDFKNIAYVGRFRYFVCVFVFVVVSVVVFVVVFVFVIVFVFVNVFVFVSGRMGGVKIGAKTV